MANMKYLEIFVQWHYAYVNWPISYFEWTGWVTVWSAYFHCCLSVAFEELFKLWYGLLCRSLLNSSDAIFSALYDGSGVIEILRGHEYLSHPFAVSLYGGNVYWTDWRTNTLARANKWTGQNVTVIQKTSAQPFDLQIFHPSRQPQGESSLSGFFLLEMRGAVKGDVSLQWQHFQSGFQESFWGLQGVPKIGGIIYF